MKYISSLFLPFRYSKLKPQQNVARILPTFQGLKGLKEAERVTGTPEQDTSAVKAVLPFLSTAFLLESAYDGKYAQRYLTPQIPARTDHCHHLFGGYLLNDACIVAKRKQSCPIIKIITIS